MTKTPTACLDCVEIHGDSAIEWLRQWPKGAEYRAKYETHLCDGCLEEREERNQAEGAEMY
jgi:hypothetical protein